MSEETEQTLSELVFEKFSSKYQYNDLDFSCYEDLYHHFDDNGSPDWILLHV